MSVGAQRCIRGEDKGGGSIPLHPRLPVNHCYEPGAGSKAVSGAPTPSLKTKNQRHLLAEQMN